MDQPLILITNDDGITAPGLRTLIEVMSSIGDIVIVANIVVFAVVVTFAAINLSVILLRYTKPDLERPFRVPLNIGRFPVLPLFGLGATTYMAIQFEFEIILSGLGIIVSGILFYFIYTKWR